MKESDIKLSKVAKSDIKIKLSKKEKKAKKKELQRTADWREERRGNWTGSQLQSLMSCGPGKSRLGWDNIDRLFSFGTTSLKYIYENAMERKTGRYIEDGDGSYAMQYGTKVEPLIARRTKEILIEKGIAGKMKPVGFKKFDLMPNAGVSSDSILVNDKNETIATVEMKACTSWGTHYERVFSMTNEKSKDFWQIQGQTIAHSVDLCYYAVAEPPGNIKDYLFYQGDIMDLYENFKKECGVSVESVKSNKVCQDALLKRIAIAEDALNDWLSDGGNLEQILNECVAFYEKNPDKLNKYIPPMPFASEMKKKKIEVSYPAWSESKTHWYVMTNLTENGASDGKWFSKKEYTYKPSKKQFRGFMKKIKE